MMKLKSRLRGTFPTFALVFPAKARARFEQFQPN